MVIRTDEGRTIPGVIIIDGRIKTLKEFFQATLVLFNSTETFVLREMQASIELPPGLTPVRSGLGTDVTAINTEGDIDQVLIGEIGPGGTGIGQFIFRGDAMGTHPVVVDFQGFITGGGLPGPVPVNGAVATTVEVQASPQLKVVVRHPSNPSGPDVTADQIYDLIVEVTNLSGRPALYTSLELFVGGSARLVDQNNQPIADSNVVRTIGTIPPGRTARLAYRVQSLVEGEIIACQAIAAANITLSVDTGSSGAPCSINNMYPANFVPLPRGYAAHGDRHQSPERPTQRAGDHLHRGSLYTPECLPDRRHLDGHSDRPHRGQPGQWPGGHLGDPGHQRHILPGRAQF